MQESSETNWPSIPGFPSSRAEAEEMARNMESSSQAGMTKIAALDIKKVAREFKRNMNSLLYLKELLHKCTESAKANRAFARDRLMNVPESDTVARLRNAVLAQAALEDHIAECYRAVAGELAADSTRDDVFRRYARELAQDAGSR